MENKNKEEKKQEKKQRVKFRFSPKLITKILLLLVLFLLVFKVIIPKFISSKPDKVSTITKSSLEKVIEINDLETLDYTYNAVADVKDEEDRIKYHVAYDGVVTAGIDFSKIDILIDEENKEISLKLPKSTIQDVRVDTGTMDYIFERRSYETETVSQEAYKACLKDLKERADQEKDLLNMADENAQSTVKALVEPWVKDIDEKYTVEVVSNEK